MVKRAARRSASEKAKRASAERAPRKRQDRDVEIGPFEPLRINYWSKHLDIKREKLSELTGYSVEYVSQVANGRRRWDQEILDKFAHAFNVSRDALLPRADDDPATEFLRLSREEQIRSLRIYRAATDTQRQ